MNKEAWWYVHGRQLKNWAVGHARLCITRFEIFSSPSFFIIGAQKCGTDALFNYLCEHPDVIPGRTKEIHFFNSDKLYYGGGIDYYNSQFPLPLQLGKCGVTFDATPKYIYCPDCPRRIYEYNPHAKMILLLRDPVERAYSAWNMYRRFHEKNLSSILPGWSSMNVLEKEGFRQLFSQREYPRFEEAICEEIEIYLSEEAFPEPSFVRRGLYAKQLERYFKYFRREQIMIIDSQNLRKETDRTLGEIARFIGLRPYNWKQGEKERRVVSGVYNDKISQQARDYLVKFYKPHNERLYKLLGHDFGW